MAPAVASPFRLPGWVAVWCTVASILVLFDSLYVLGIFYKAQQLIPAPILTLWTMYGETDTQYDVSGKGIAESNGWMPTQSHLNVVEVAGQLSYLALRSSRPAAAFSIILISSIATFWKTVCYMGIIAFAPDPLKHMPSLTCATAWAPSCPADLFKFSFNLWWLGVPFAIAWAAHARLSAFDKPAAAAAEGGKRGGKNA